ncbi:hypothetical protein [Pedobacter sp. L105]|uniref:hypothetical protein n=1 Tax=Pedobacter sp. L105 TaxID=1641871 RepID=UPI00131BFD07|nr:hypothetical protein [Pedobacter sp. L105]
MNGAIAFLILLSNSCLNRPAMALSRNAAKLMIIAAPLHQPAKRFMRNTKTKPQIINPKKNKPMKSTLNRTSKQALHNGSAKGNQVITTSPVKKDVVFEVVLEEGMTCRPFLIVYEKGIDARGLPTTKRTVQSKSNTGTSYMFELKDQSKPLYFSLLLTGYLMDITIAREYHFEPGDDVKINVHQTDVPNIYDLDFSGRGSGKYRCQNEFLYAVETDTVKVLPEFTKENQYNKDNQLFRYTNLLYDLIEKYQPEMSDYSYHLLHADVLGNMGNYLLTNLQVKLHEQLSKKDTAGFKVLAKSFSDQYQFDFVGNIPDSVLLDSKEYALFMIERIKTKVLIDFATVNYAIVYERIKRVDNVALRDKMIAALFKYYIRLEDDNGSMIIDAISLVKDKGSLDTLKTLINYQKV